MSGKMSKKMRKIKESAYMAASGATMPNIPAVYTQKATREFLKALSERIHTGEPIQGLRLYSVASVADMRTAYDALLQQGDDATVTVEQFDEAWTKYIHGTDYPCKTATGVHVLVENKCTECEKDVDAEPVDAWGV